MVDAPLSGSSLPVAGFREGLGAGLVIENSPYSRYDARVVIIEVPDQELGAIKLTAAEARLDFAIGLYTSRKASMGRAARIAQLSYPEFMHELGGRGIAINYSEADLAQDIATLKDAGLLPD